MNPAVIVMLRSRTDATVLDSAARIKELGTLSGQIGEITAVVADEVRKRPIASKLQKQISRFRISA